MSNSLILLCRFFYFFVIEIIHYHRRFSKLRAMLIVITQIGHVFLFGILP